MIKKIMYLALVFTVFISSIAMASKVETEDTASPWQVLNLGPAIEGDFLFNTATLKYARKKDGSIDKNIILYQEKEINNNTGSVQYKYYSITEGKINVAEHAILLGNESFYTRKGKFRWTDEPMALAWITVKPKTMGGDRYQQIVSYVEAHSEEILARS